MKTEHLNQAIMRRNTKICWKVAHSSDLDQTAKCLNCVFAQSCTIPFLDPRLIPMDSMF